MNSVFQAFKSNKNNNNSNSSNGETSNSKKNSVNVNKKTLNLKDPNNSYEKLRHIREKMSSLNIDDDDIQINIIKRIPVDMDTECKENAGGGGVGLVDCVDGNSSSSSCPLTNGTNGTISSSTSSSSLTTSLSSIKKHESENYSSENNLLTKCCKADGNDSQMDEEATIIGAGSSEQSVKENCVNTNNLVIIKSMPLINDINSKSTSNIFNKPNTNSNSRTNRPRLSLSNIGGINNLMPSVHGRPNTNGLPGNGSQQQQPRTRLSTHQRNLSLDFR